jgi:glycosyltransferase involved in cell wall biosynthesis
MILNDAYYLLKPIMPWRLRMALRQTRAKIKRPARRDVWPIDEKAGTIPPNWPGWPAGKRFGLVLTHDVEGTLGLSRVEQLMELEQSHGFRSAFNFVPEGEYRSSDALRDRLESEGFEVGIHGLEHDGKLYASKEKFARKAERINEYLRHWKAVGFRSPLMQHKLAWLHQLNIEYDCSTFDTDPFEPEPDGVRTIFPFWVAGRNGQGYVELPYTLVQDFTLFEILREKNVDIWKKKLDWIAGRGGMALLNTHPDYMAFGGKTPSRGEFKIELYEEFLTYVREKYAGEYWHAVPREVSRFYCDSLPVASRNTRKRVCMLVHNSYESDNRVRRYAEALARRGDLVDVIAIADGKVPLGKEEISGVTAERIQRRGTNQKNKWAYAWRLMSFFVRSTIFLTRRHQRVRYDLIHVHNLPDFLIFAAWYPKRTGAKLILDIHDIVPEFFASKFHVAPTDEYVKFLKKVEKSSASFADYVIVSNHLWRDRLIGRSVSADKCDVFLNHVDPAIFYRREKVKADDKFVILFPGSLNWHQGLDIAIDAFVQVKKAVPNAEFHLYGRGPMRIALEEQAIRLGLSGSVKFSDSVSLDKIASIVANADLGVVPKRADDFGDEAFSTKIMEFMSQGVPVVVSKTKIDTFYFDDSVVRFFKSGSPDDMARAMLEVIENEPLRRNLIEAGLEYVDNHSWEGRKKVYFDLVDSLTTEVGETSPAEAAKEPIIP